MDTPFTGGDAHKLCGLSQWAGDRRSNAPARSVRREGTPR